MNLISAVRSKDFEIIKVLLDYGADVNVYDTFMGISPLLLACRYNNKKMVEMLLKKGADVNRVDSFGNTSLFYAFIYNNLSVATLLIDRGANIDPKIVEYPKKQRIYDKLTHSQLNKLRGADPYVEYRLGLIKSLLKSVGKNCNTSFDISDVTKFL